MPNSQRRPPDEAGCKNGESREAQPDEDAPTVIRPVDLRKEAEAAAGSHRCSRDDNKQDFSHAFPIALYPAGPFLGETENPS